MQIPDSLLEALVDIRGSAAFGTLSRTLKTLFGQVEMKLALLEDWM